MKRPLVCAAAVLAAAVVLSTTLPQLKMWILAAGVVAGALVFVRPVPSALRSGALVVCLALLAAVGSTALAEARLRPLMQLVDGKAPVRMTVLAETEGSGSSRISLYGLVQVGEEWKTVSAEAYAFEVAGWQPGDRVEGVLRFSLPADQSRVRFLRSRGQFAYANVESLVPLAADEKLPGGLRVWGAKVNCALSQGLLTALPDQNGSFLQSVLLGRRENLADGVDEDMRRSGVAHVMVVSGLHLSLLCGAATALLRWGRAGALPCAAVGCGVCLVVMAVTGFTPSVVRGGIMLLLGLLAELVGRRRDSLSALAAAVVAMVLYNPYVVYSWSFLLSVGSMLSILVFGPVLRRVMLGWRRQRLPKTAWLDAPLEVLAVSLGAAVYTYPMLSVMFGGLAVYGPLGNLLITPFVGILLVLAAVAALLGSLGLGGAAAFVAAPAGVLANLCRRAAGFVSGLPGSWAPIDQRWQVIWLGGVALVLTLLVVARPKEKRLLKVFVPALCLPLLVGLACSGLVQRGGVELYCPEGSSALVVVYDGQAVIVDADRTGMEEAEKHGAKPVLCTFGGGSAAQAAAILQDAPEVCAAMPGTMAEEILPYIDPATQVLELSQSVWLSDSFCLRGGRGYTMIEIDGLRVLKLLDGYVIIENENAPPPADFVVDAAGIVRPGAADQSQPVRSLCFKSR